MNRMKKTLIAIIMILAMMFSMISFTACTIFDSDGDGYTDDFEDEHSDVLDKDDYNWHVDNEDLMD